MMAYNIKVIQRRFSHQ